MFSAVETGRRIAEKRKEKGLSQEDLATLVQSSQGLIAKIETGKRTVQVDLLVDIADALSTDCDYLLGGISTQYLSAAESTGLSEKALSRLRDYCQVDSDNLNLNKALADVPKIQTIDALLSFEQGDEVLSRISEYLGYDFTQFYVDEVNDEGNGFVPYSRSIGFKGRSRETYLFLGPENFEFAAIGRITESIKALKAVYLKQADEKQTKRTRGRKKKEDSTSHDKKEMRTNGKHTGTLH